MEFDQDKVDEMVLALLWLTAFDVDKHGARTWKSHDWDALDRYSTQVEDDQDVLIGGLLHRGRPQAAAWLGIFRIPMAFPSSDGTVALRSHIFAPTRRHSNQH